MKKNTNSHKATNGFLRQKLLIFALFFGIVGCLLLVSLNAAPKPKNPGGGGNKGGASLFINPGSQTVKAGDTLQLAISADTKGQAVNAVQATLTYPMNHFEIVDIDTSGSAFDIDVVASSDSGVVQIARGSFTPINSSNALVAKLNLRAKSSGRKLQVKFEENSILASSETNLNILQLRSGGTYTIK